MFQRASRLLYLLLFLFPFALFAPTILGRRALFFGTPLNQFVPWWTWSWEAVASGVFPIWNTMLGMGAPLIANYQSALFYPPTWLYFIAYTVGGIGAMAWLMAIMVVMHLFWATLGMALLIRELKLGKLAQLVGGLAFGLGGYLVARAGFLSINAAVSWLPWIILGATRLVIGFSYQPAEQESSETAISTRNNKIMSGYLLLVSVIAMQLLAGHAQTAWYSVLLAVTWVLYLGLIDPWLNKRRARPKASSSSNSSEIEDDQQVQGYGLRQSRVAMLLIFFGSALVFAIGLAAVQLLPTAEYLLESQRSAAVDYDFAMSYSFWPWRFLSFLAPGLFGNPATGDYWGYANYWEDAVYIGLIPFILAIAAILTRGKKIARQTLVNPRFIGFLVVLILVTFLIALGRNTPIFPWLYQYVPTFDMFQAPTRISVLAIFALAILAAIGAESWSRPEGKLLYWLRLGVMAAAAITIGAGLALFLSRSLSLGIRPSLIRATAWLGLWGLGLGLLALKAPLRVEDPNQDREWGWWHWAVVMWIGLDLVVAGWGLNPSVDLSVYQDPSPTAEEVEQALDGGRIYLNSEDEEQLKFERFLRFDTFQPFEEGEDWQSLRASLLPNITVLDTLPSANNFDPLLPARFSSWLEVMQDVDAQVLDQMLNLMGVTVVESIDLNETYGVRFDKREAYPRFRWVSCGIGAADELMAIELIKNNTIDHDSGVILETASAGPQPICNRENAAQLQLVTEQENLNNVRVNSSSAGYLVMSDVWYPGWQAFVDGELAKLWRANYLFRAVAVPAGEHEVTIAYQPKVFYGGVAVSSVAFIGLIAIVLIWLIKVKSAKS
ncbi:MAG: YfhO family protein [Anaerolineales bacterium]